MIRTLKWLLSIVALIFWNTQAKAENPIETHFLVDLAARNTSAKNVSNFTFFGQSNFDALRVRLFLEKKVSDRVEVFTQFLSNNATSHRIYGAYVRLKFGSRWGNLEAGLIRNPFGTWGPRTYSDKNPLVGIPLGYGYHTAMIVYKNTLQKSPAELLSYRGRGGDPSPSYGISSGLPLVYDNCWNTGLLLFGGDGKWEYMAGALAGSLSNPSIELRRSRPQLSGRVGFRPALGMVMGGSLAFGPYLTKANEGDLSPGGKTSDYNQTLLGLDLNFEQGKFIGYAEGMYNRWVHPYVSEPLKVYSAYLEGTYKFAAQFFISARYDRMEFSKIADPAGGQSVWDYPLYRVETGLGYRFDRNVTIKLVGQLTRFPGQPQLNDDILATQISTSF
ncbi:MAG TPA: hypothetical protein VI546_06555 [candidate division Zixibacteria bacterium]|nr:hypothetical protein [candidate division Zixibacteria bacterium]